MKFKIGDVITWNNGERYVVRIVFVTKDTYEYERLKDDGSFMYRSSGGVKNIDFDAHKLSKLELVLK